MSVLSLHYQTYTAKAQRDVAKVVMIELAFYRLLDLLYSFGDLRGAIYPDVCTTGTGEGAVRKLGVSQVRIRARKAGIKNARRLAQLIDIHENTAYRWWNNDPNMQSYDRDVLLKLCDLFGCGPDGIITVEEQMS